MKTMGCLMGWDGFIWIFITMMGKSAVPVQIVMFIVYLMKNSSMCLKNDEEKT